MSEKTEQPTDKRLREARKDGQFARSRLLSAAAAILGALAGFAIAGPLAWARLQAWTTALFSGDPAPSAALHQGLWVLAWAVLPPLFGAFLGALVAATAFAGFQLNPGHVGLKLERLNPADGFKRIFSPGAWVEALKALLVAAVVLAFAWALVRDDARQVLASARLSGAASFELVWQAVRGLVVKGALLILGLGVLDYLYARWTHRRDLMMTKEEVKQEYKDAEGDPRHKSERKALHRQILAGGKARGVQKATAVVVNPTHIAVALRYDEAECDAPYLVAKGRDEEAFAIRKEAERLRIPVVKDIPLARSLIHYEVGEEIPEELYRAAAAVLTVALESQDAD